MAWIDGQSTDGMDRWAEFRWHGTGGMDRWAWIDGQSTGGMDRWAAS